MSEAAEQDKGRPAEPRIGYLAVVEEQDGALAGGYLIVSHRGRPLEFHCTETLHPSRAQQILFGQTLRPYLVAEQLGKALIQAASFQPDLLLVEDADARGVASVCKLEVCHLEPATALETLEPKHRELLEHLAESIDPAEPFGRVREALAEARRYGGETTPADDMMGHGGSSYAA